MENEITINNLKYISEEQHLKELLEIKEKLETLEKSQNSKDRKKFSFKDELKLYELFSKLFTEASNPINEDYAVNKGVNILDPANVLLCSGKTEEAKRFLSRFKDIDDGEKEYPKLEYNTINRSGDKGGEISSKFSMEYIIKILNIIDSQSEAVKFYVNSDYPITIENQHFRFVLAPRISDIEGDEKW